MSVALWLLVGVAAARLMTAAGYLTYLGDMRAAAAAAVPAEAGSADAALRMALPQVVVAVVLTAAAGFGWAAWRGRRGGRVGVWLLGAAFLAQAALAVRAPAGSRPPGHAAATAVLPDWLTVALPLAGVGTLCALVAAMTLLALPAVDRYLRLPPSSALLRTAEAGARPTRPRPPVSAAAPQADRAAVGLVIALCALAPWAAECAWGGYTIDRVPFTVAVMAPLYGGAAVLVRETTRRLGGGWATVALLAAAFGVVQAGLVDQSLFNPHYLDDTEFAATGGAARRTLIPGLGISAVQLLDFVGNHIVLTICAPIAVVEACAGPRRRGPWLDRTGLAVVAALYLGGSLMIFAGDSGRKNYLAGPAHLAGAFAAAALLVAAGVWVARRRAAGRRTAVPGRPPRPVWAGVVVAVAYLGDGWASGWAGVGIRVAVVAVAVAVLVRWSRRAGWGRRHPVAAWGAALLMTVCGAFATPPYDAAPPPLALVSDICGVLIGTALVAAAWWRSGTAEASRVAVAGR